MKSEINKKEVLEKLIPLVENTAMRFNFIPVEVDFSRENHKNFIRVFLFSYEKPISIDDCEKFSRSLNEFLDDLFDFKYYLEVSSPGLERKFKSNKEYLIFKGRNVSIKLYEPLEDMKDVIFKATLLDFDENEGVTVKRLEDGKEILLPLEKIKNTRLYLEEKIK